MYRWMCQGTATRYYRFHRCTVRIASTCQAKRVLRYVEHVHPLQYTPDTGYLDSRAFGYKDRLAAPSRLVVWELSREPVLSIRSSSCCGTMCLCMAFLVQLSTGRPIRHGLTTVCTCMHVRSTLCFWPSNKPANRLWLDLVLLLLPLHC
jgi:hypothetical protein